MYGPRWSRDHVLLSSAARTTSGYSVVLNAGEYGQAIFFLELTAASGTPRELDVKLEYSPDNTSWFSSTKAFTLIDAATGTSTKEAIAVSELGKYIRFSYTITGTCSFTFSLKGAFKS